MVGVRKYYYMQLVVIDWMNYSA